MLLAYLSTSDDNPHTTLAAVVALNIPPLADPTSNPVSFPISLFMTSDTSKVGANGAAEGTGT